MKLPWLFICGGARGILMPEAWSRRYQNSSFDTGTQTGGGFFRHSGSRRSSGAGSITAPERIWAPIVEAFSITQTESSGLSCFVRIANARPAGPAPTTTRSYSMVSRSLMAGSLKGWLRNQPGIVRFRREWGKSAFQTTGVARSSHSAFIIVPSARRFHEYDAAGRRCRHATRHPATDPALAGHWTSPAPGPFRRIPGRHRAPEPPAQ